MKFSALGLSEPLVRAVATEGYADPTPIQSQAIPHVLAGRDLMGCAQTGTGKTAAFALPILERLTAARPQPGGGRRIRVLVLSPTRELALQIADSFAAYGRHTPLKSAVIFGGVNQNPQVKALRHGVDVLVATPGRLLDLMNQGFVDLRGVEIFVLDEADRMLDMGFLPDIRRVIVKLPTVRQTLLFSATMPNEIRTLAHSILREPVSINVAPVATTAENIEESVYFVDRRNKPRLLAHVLSAESVTRALVFTRTKRGADRVVKQLQRSGIRAAAIHGNKSQAARQNALESFRASHTPVLVATDIASRGIDVDAVSHVFNYDIPEVAETYVHRIGRTARAGASGVAVSFCDGEERGDFKAIERLIQRPIPVCKNHPEYSAASDDSDREFRSAQESSDLRPTSKRPSRPGQRPAHSRPRYGSSRAGGSSSARSSSSGSATGHSVAGHSATGHAAAGHSSSGGSRYSGSTGNVGRSRGRSRRGRGRPARS